MIECVWKDEQNRIVIATSRGMSCHDEPLSALFERWHKPSLTTYQGRKKAIAKAFGILRYQPVVIDADTALAMLEGPRGETSRFVNVRALELIDHTDEMTTFVFRSGNVWSTKTPAGLTRRLEDAMRVADHLYGGGINKKMLSWCRNRKRNRGNSDANLV